jgi:hypothetical protein
MPKLFKNLRENKQELDESQMQQPAHQKQQSATRLSIFRARLDKKAANKKCRPVKEIKQGNPDRINETLI